MNDRRNSQKRSTNRVDVDSLQQNVLDGAELLEQGTDSRFGDVFSAFLRAETEVNLRIEAAVLRMTSRMCLLGLGIFFIGFLESPAHTIKKSR